MINGFVVNGAVINGDAYIFSSDALSQLTISSSGELAVGHAVEGVSSIATIGSGVLNAIIGVEGSTVITIAGIGDVFGGRFLDSGLSSISVNSDGELAVAAGLSGSSNIEINNDGELFIQASIGGSSGIEINATIDLSTGALLDGQSNIALSGNAELSSASSTILPAGKSTIEIFSRGDIKEQHYARIEGISTITVEMIEEAVGAPAKGIGMPSAHIFILMSEGRDFKLPSQNRTLTLPKGLSRGFAVPQTTSRTFVVPEEVAA